MALLMMDGFEHLPYMKDGWAWGASTLNTAPGRNAGTKALSVPTYSSGDFTYNLGTDAATVVVGLAFKFIDTSLFGATSSSAYIVALNGDNGNTRHLTLCVTSGGSLTIKRGTPSGTVLATQSVGPTIQPGVWYFLELKATIADSGGIAVVKLNGTQVINYTGDTRNAGTLTSTSHIKLSGYGFTQYDDMYVLDGTGATFNDFIGEYAIKSVVPVEDGDTNNFVGSDGNNVDNYLLVSDDDIDTTVSSATSTEQELYYYDVEMTDTIKAVQPVALSRLSEVGSKQIKFIGKSSVSSPHDDASPRVLSTNWTAVSGEVHELDLDGNAWDSEELSQTQFGIEVI